MDPVTELSFEMITSSSNGAGLVVIDHDPERQADPARLVREAGGIILVLAGRRFSLPGFEKALQLQQPRDLTIAEVDDNYRPRRTYEVNLP